MTATENAPPAPAADRPLFRRDAERFRQQRHLGTIILFRPLALRFLTLFPLGVVAALLFAATRLTVQQRFTGLASTDATGDRITVTVASGAAPAIQRGDRVGIELPAASASPMTRVQGTVAMIANDDCRSGAQAELVIGLAQTSRRCLVLGIALDTPVPRQRAPQRVELSAPARSYLRYFLER